MCKFIAALPTAISDRDRLNRRRRTRRDNRTGRDVPIAERPDQRSRRRHQTLSCSSTITISRMTTVSVATFSYWKERM